MKIRNIFILTALLLVIFCLGACDSWDGSGNQGSIVINFGDSGGRYTIDTNTMIYTITLTSPGKSAITRKTNKGDAPISISPVPEGEWNIKIDAIGDRIRGRQQEVNGVTVAVTAGKRAYVPITMIVTGTRVSNWTQLKQDFLDTTLPNEHDIELVNSFFFNETDEIKFDNGKTITLWSRTEGATIMRSPYNGRQGNNVFLIDKGTIILDGTKGGKIIISGNANDSCEKALINVQGDGPSTLIMREGVTLTNNKTLLGGGVYIKGINASFYMSGGTISKNNVDRQGVLGAVYIATEDIL